VEDQVMKDDQESKQALMRVYLMGRGNARRQARAIQIIAL
jgi:hypothetical protein